MTRSRSPRGQGLVEFALVAPVIFLMLVGLFDLGDAVYSYNTLAHGTQTAAAYASLHCNYSGSSYTVAQLNQQVLQAGQTLQAGQLTVSATPASGGSCGQPGTTITVTSTYVYRPLTAIMQNFFPRGGLSLQTSAQVLAQ